MPRRRRDNVDASQPRKQNNVLALLGYGAASIAIVVGWVGRAERHIMPEYGLGYWLGIAGASMMGLLLLYPVRKHVRHMHWIGSTRLWFQTHMFLGVLGPILILYHSNFSLGSVNSRVALFCTILVAVSGLAGRYLYAKVHIGWSGSRQNLQQLIERAKISAAQSEYASAFVPELLERMSRYDRKVLEPAHSFFAAAFLPLTLHFRTRWARFWLTRYVRRQLRKTAVTNSVVAQNRHRLERVFGTFVEEHLRRVRRVASFSFYERMFSFWHLFHLPFFYILVVAALIHIFAVHMY